MKKSILVIVLVIICVGCRLTNDRIKSHWWKGGDGNLGLSDVLHFGKSDYYKLRNDTILKDNKAVAVIIDKNFRFFGDNILTIKSITTNQIATFYEK